MTKRTESSQVTNSGSTDAALPPDVSRLSQPTQLQHSDENVQKLAALFQQGLYDSCVTLGLFAMSSDDALNEQDRLIALFHVASSFRLQNQHQRALHYYELALTVAFSCQAAEHLAETIAQILHFSGICSFELGKYSDARYHLSRIPEKYRTSNVYQLLARTFTHVPGEQGNALECYRAILKKQPLASEAIAAVLKLGYITECDTFEQSPVVSYHEALRQIREHKYKDALVTLKQLAEASPKNVLVWLELASLCLRMGDYMASSAAFQKVRTLDPFCTTHMDKYAALIKGKGHIWELGRLASEMITACPKSPEPWVIMARLSQTKNQLERAVTFCNEALKIKGDHAEAFFVKGLVLCEQGLASDGLQAMKYAQTLDSDVLKLEAIVANNLKVRQSQEAGIYGRIMADRYSWHPKTLVTLGMINQSVGDLELARKGYERALQLDPDCIEAVNALCTILMAESKFDLAVETLEKYLPYHSTDILHANLANVYLAKKNYDGALQHYYIALGLNPEFEPAKEGVARVEKLLRGEEYEQDEDGSIMQENAEDFDDSLE